MQNILSVFTTDDVIMDEITLIDSRLSRCGVFAFTPVTRLSMFNLNFTGNYGVEAGLAISGGAICVGGASAVRIANSNFENNTVVGPSAKSAVASFEAITTLEISNSKFLGNTASTGPACFDMTFVLRTNFSRVSFLNNSGRSVCTE